MKQNSTPADVRNRFKRRIIIVFVCACLLLLVAYAAVSILERILYGTGEKEDYSSKYIFYDADYEMDIFDDTEYLELNRYITFSDGTVSVAITDGDYAAYGDEVEFLAEDYLHSIIYGDVEAYNSCFSEEYYTQNQPHDRFTMQKLYNITLTRMEKVTESSGDEEYTLYGFTVEYMIRHNNGTFRSDLGSDGIRAQYLVVSDREGTWKIDRVITYSYS